MDRKIVLFITNKYILSCLAYIRSPAKPWLHNNMESVDIIVPSLGNHDRVL